MIKKQLTIYANFDIMFGNKIKIRCINSGRLKTDGLQF